MKTENVISQVSIPSTGLAELKVAFEKALEERKAIDARIEEIRKEIGSRLQEAQSLHEAAKSLTEVVLPKRAVGADSAICEINVTKVWRFFLKYILPVLLMLAALWFVLGGKKSVSSTRSAEHPQAQRVGYCAGSDTAG